MHKSGDINHVHGLYRSVCCDVEHSLSDNVKFPPCPGSGGKSGESRCAGRNATWIMVRLTHMINR
jgi:hypothetical protein